MNFGMDPLVGRVVYENGVKCYLVEDGEHSRRRIGEEIGQNRFGESKVEVRDFEGLGVG